MNFKLQIIVALVVIFGIVHIINSVRRKKLEVKHALVWFGVGIIYLLFDLIPRLQLVVCRLLGISVPQNMLIFLAIGLILCILYSQTVIISKQSEVIKRLIQELGLLQAEKESSDQ